MKKYLRKITTRLYYTRIFKENKNDICTLLGLLADQKSKDTFNGILKAYTTIFGTPQRYFSKVANDECCCYHFTTPSGFKVYGTENPYFLSDIFSLDKDMVYLDGGAYIGDSVQLLYKTLGGPCKYTYAFEPDDENFKKLLISTQKFGDKIKCVNAGLDNHDGIVSFLKADAGSRVSEEGTEIIQVVDAKRFLSELIEDLPTFIKLDIEGKESEVLDAMAEYIKEEQPNLAISIYHKLEDLWRIPLQIYKLNPKYKIYIRHQSNYYTETVCYAIKT